MKSGKKLCIIGGMGPLATADCYRRIIESSPANTDQEHIETLIFSDSQIPDRTSCILSGESDDLIKKLQDDFKIANDWGADLFIIPCNTCHFYMDEMKKMTNAKILNMVEIAVTKSKDKAYVFGTEGTRLSGIYKDEINKSSRSYLDLTDDESKIVMDVIYSIKSGLEPKLKNFPKLKKIMDEKLNSGASVIVACTELSMLDFDREKIIDAMGELVKAVVKEAFDA